MVAVLDVGCAICTISNVKSSSSDRRRSTAGSFGAALPDVCVRDASPAARLMMMCVNILLESCKISVIKNTESSAVLQCESADCF